MNAQYIITVLVVSLALSLVLPNSCSAANSPYRLLDRTWPGELGRAVHAMAKDLSSGVDMVISADQLHMDGQTVDSLDNPLDMPTATAMLQAQWDDDEPQTLSSSLEIEERDPEQVYDWLVELIAEQSPNASSELQHLRTLGKIFDACNDSTFTNLQGLVMIMTWF